MHSRHLAAALLSVTACTRAVPERITAPVEPAAEAKSGAVTPASPAAAPIDPAVASLMSAAFERHVGWGRVDDELRWAPFLCRLPMPARPHMSRAEGGDHAQKLYSLFARQRERYVGPGVVSTPIRVGAVGGVDAGREPFVGQVVVKASYVPEPAGDGETARPSMDGLGMGDHFDPFATHGGVRYRAGGVAGYYVIAEVPRDTPGSDDGFVYGTLTADGRVTSAGRVAPCMGCHVEATQGRLFGLKAK